MESEARIIEAKRRIRKLANDIGSKRGARIHQIAWEDNENRRRSLEGLCGGCDNMRIELFSSNGRDRVKIVCTTGNNPAKLYYNTPLGTSAECGDHTPPEG